MISGIICFLALAAMWFVPMLVKHGKTGKEAKKFYLFALLAGMLSTVPALVVQSGISFLLGKIAVDRLSAAATLLIGIGFMLITIGMSEELFKFLFARGIIRRVPDLSRAGCMLMMGLAGLGFGLVETFSVGSAAEGILRGVLNMHLFLQLWMGRYIWQAWDAKARQDKSGYRKNVVLALCVPIVLHAMFDYFLTKGTSALGGENAGIGFLYFGIAIVEAAVFIIAVMKGARRVLEVEAASADEKAAA